MPLRSGDFSYKISALKYSLIFSGSSFERKSFNLSREEIYRKTWKRRVIGILLGTSLLMVFFKERSAMISKAFHYAT